MPDILIRMEMPRTCADCHDADLPTAIAWLGAKCPWAHGIIDPGVYDLLHERHPDCPLVELPEQTVETNLYDIEEIHPNCTVQILRNSVTGEVSVGWWPNDNKPIETKEGN